MEQRTGKPILYQIRVKDVFDDQWFEWIDGTVLLLYEECVTVLTCSIADQAALQGLLRRLYSLGLTLISVNPVQECEPLVRSGQ